MRILLTLLLLACPLYSQKKEKVDTSIEKALDYLIKKQKSDGSIYDHNHSVTMTSLAIMEFAASGHQPDDPTQEGESMRKALDFVLQEKHQDNTGYYGRSDNSRMYGHGIITLMLAEMTGMGIDKKQDDIIRKRLEKAIQLILWSQKQKNKNDKRQYGGWRYEPNSRDSDLSATIWQLMSLRAANDAGIPVPKEAIDDAVNYLKECYHSGRKNNKITNHKSAFGYHPGRGPEFAMAAAGMLAMQVCGQYDADETKGAADWLMNKKINYHERFFFYGTYYFAQSMYQRGDKYAEHAKKQVELTLFKHQQPDGSWDPHNGEEKNAGRTYATAMGILSLCVTYHFLPIYQK
ncbi:MAG: terpene cyclase/mutase family protein [Lentisphaeraceae bacterium]|nr:terpene cyclase/mutase family protein [Lentisphaeraceae bacterium]